MAIILKNTPDWQAYLSLWHKILELVPRRCPFCHREHALIGHGKRRRQVIGLGRKRLIWVQRMKCKHCGKNVTVHPEFIIKKYHVARPVVQEVKALYRAGNKLIYIQHKLQEIFRCKFLCISSIRRWAIAPI